jgi:hypothetical protein
MASLPRGADDRRKCEVVIFPGVRIERHGEAGLDLAHRVRGPAGGDGLGDAGGTRPRKTS